MRSAILAFIVCSSLLCACANIDSPIVELQDVRFTLPGDYSEQTTSAELRERFGASHVTEIADPDALGQPGRMLVLFADDPLRRATVRFHGGGLDGPLASITVTERNSIWRGKHGVRIDTTLAGLGKLNGGKFFLYGFDAHGAMQVRDGWNAGALDVSEGEHLYFGVDLGHRDGAAPAAQTADYGMWSSDDAALAPLAEQLQVTALSAWSSLDDEWGRLLPKRNATPAAIQRRIAVSDHTFPAQANLARAESAKEAVASQ